MREIGAALSGAAASLEARVKQERAFVEHASHVIRTPLTALRFELEDLTLRDDVSEDVVETARRCLTQLNTLDTDTSEVIATVREYTLLGRPLAPMQEVARSVTNHWARTQAAYDSTFRSFLHGELDLQLTPGLIEQILDQVLAGILIDGTGDVELSFTGQAGHVRVDVHASGPSGADHSRMAIPEALVTAMGGSISGAVFEDGGLKILLPGR